MGQNVQYESVISSHASQSTVDLYISLDYEQGPPPTTIQGQLGNEDQIPSELSPSFRHFQTIIYVLSTYYQDILYLTYLSFYE